MTVETPTPPPDDAAGREDPIVPDVPEVPEVPAEPATPAVPGAPEVPAEPAEAPTPAVPAEPVVPDAPVPPDVPAPDTPAAPEPAAAAPARRMTVHRADGAQVDDGAVAVAPAPAGGGGGGRASMRVYSSEPAAPKRRRWPKVVGVIVAILVIAGLGAGGYAYWYLGDTVSAITQTSDRKQQEAQAGLDVPLPDQPITALVVGEDRRPGEGPGRSDTLMLVRVDPRTQSIAMMSFPRDLVVEVPGYGRRPINEAYEIGQEPLALATIKELTGVSINYLVPVDFKAFQRIVGTFGGVWLPIDRRYFNENDGSAANNFAEIDIQPGYQLVRGRDALAFARYRHTDSDIIRMARQQAFVREFKKRVDRWGAATRIIELVSILRDNLKVLGSNKKNADARLLLDYGRLIAGIPRSNMVQVRLEDTAPSATYQGKVEASPQTVQQAVNEFLRPDLQSGEAIANRDVAKDPKKKQAKPKYDQATTAIEVRNGNGTPAAAADAAWQLVENGWKLAQSAGDSVVPYLTTTVYYDEASPGAKEASKAIAEAFGADSEVKPLTAAARTEIEQNGIPIKTPVVVVVGKTYIGDLAPPKVPVLPEKEEAQITRDPKRDLQMWREAERKAGFTLWMPTVLYAGAQTRDPLYSSQPPYRVYKTGGHKAVYVTYAADAYDQVFGMQAIEWNDPPILEGPTTTREYKGRTLLLYFNGARLQRVAWKEDGISYWLENSLTGRIPNSAMIAMAKSARPVSG